MNAAMVRPECAVSAYTWQSEAHCGVGVALTTWDVILVFENREFSSENGNATRSI